MLRRTGGIRVLGAVCYSAYLLGPGSPVPWLERANQTSQGFCWEPRLLLANELALPLLGSSGQESPSVLAL